MLPIVECRGAIPYGCAFGLPWWQVVPVAVVGNLLPVPFIILFIRKIFRWLKDKGTIGRKIYDLEQKALEKAHKVASYKFLLVGLIIFVAIPAPGTGAWTGALIAALLDMRLKTAFFGIALGAALAGVAIGVMAYGIGAIFTFLA